LPIGKEKDLRDGIILKADSGSETDKDYVFSILFLPAQRTYRTI
jgi:hypothetical protein